MDLETGTAAGGHRGLKVVDVLQESTAAKSGIGAGDVILSINGQVTERRDQIGRIIAGSASGDELKMSVIKAGTGQEQTIAIRVP
jgi:serine protease Do